MTLLNFIISSLAVWRVTHLIQAEDGPFDLIFKIRKLAGNSFWGSLMDCFYCLSIWVALLPGLYFGITWAEKVLYWLSCSGAAILLQKFFFKENDSSQS